MLVMIATKKNANDRSIASESCYHELQHGLSVRFDDAK
jgi:hypothetical protein